MSIRSAARVITRIVKLPSWGSAVLIPGVSDAESGTRANVSVYVLMHPKNTLRRSGAWVNILDQDSPLMRNVSRISLHLLHVRKSCLHGGDTGTIIQAHGASERGDLGGRPESGDGVDGLTGGAESSSERASQSGAPPVVSIAAVALVTASCHAGSVAKAPASTPTAARQAIGAPTAAPQRSCGTERRFRRRKQIRATGIYAGTRKVSICHGQDRWPGVVPTPSR